MNKILIIFILLIILFEFPFSNSTISYAADGEELGLNTKVLDALVSLSSGIISIVVWVPKFIATALISVVNSAVGIVAKIEGTNGRVNNNITPYKIFFNKYKPGWRPSPESGVSPVDVCRLLSFSSAATSFILPPFIRSVNCFFHNFPIF